MRDLRRVYEFAFNGLNRWPGYLRPDPRVINGTFQLGETEITPLPVPHGRILVNGYLFKRRGELLAAYISDCKSVPDEIVAQIAGVRHLIIDALRRNPHPTHLNIDEALAVVEKVRPAHTWFTHLCHDLLHEEAEPTLPPGVRIAYDGLRIDC